MIGAFVCLILLSAVLVTASTKGWLFSLNKNNGEHVAARIQVITDDEIKMKKFRAKCRCLEASTANISSQYFASDEFQWES